MRQEIVFCKTMECLDEGLGMEMPYSLYSLASGSARYKGSNSAKGGRHRP
jgi:hypothetical protein